MVITGSSPHFFIRGSLVVRFRKSWNVESLPLVTNDPCRLILSILNHCQIFRLRNPHILNACSEFFIANHQNLDPTLSHSSARTAIRLSPAQHPTYIIDIMLCYVCRERYPLPFVNRIFNPYFLSVLQARTRPRRLDCIHSLLKMFNTSLTLECLDYDGPLLPQDHSAKVVFHGGCIKRIVNYIVPELEELAESPNCMTKFAILQHLPTNELYLIFQPTRMGSIFSLNTARERNVNVTIPIHPPEYYNSNGEHLVGPQAMHPLGLKVVTLEFDVPYKLKVHPAELRKYLVERLKQAYEELPVAKVAQASTATHTATKYQEQ